MEITCGISLVTDCLLLSIGCVIRGIGIFLNVIAVELTHLAGVAVDVVLLLKTLIGLQEVVHMVGTQYKATVGGRNAQLVEGCLHRKQVLDGHFETTSSSSTFAGGGQHWGLGCILLGAERMCCLGELGIVDGV